MSDKQGVEPIYEEPISTDPVESSEVESTTTESSEVESTASAETASPSSPEVESPSIESPVRTDEEVAQAREKLLQYLRDGGSNKSEIQPGVESKQLDDLGPNPAEDFAGWVKSVEQERRKQREEQLRLSQLHEVEKQLTEFYNWSVDNVRSKYSDINEAQSYMFEQRANELKKLSHIFPQLSTQEGLAQAIGQEVRSIIAMCAERKLNPAEELYKLSCGMGYKPLNNRNNPTKENLGSFEEKKNGSRSLTKSGGARNGGIGSLEDLSKLSEEEFYAVYSDQETANKIDEILRNV